jgi:hypothetical protein
MKLLTFSNMELDMTLNELDFINAEIETTSNDKNDEYSIPLDMTDIISICRDFSSLGWQVQNQIENILETGIEEAIRNGNVKQEALPRIKYFLQQVVSNPYFGDAASQAEDCLCVIEAYENKHKISYISKAN